MNDVEPSPAPERPSWGWLALRVGAAIVLLGSVFALSTLVSREKTRELQATKQLKQLAAGIVHCSARLQSAHERASITGDARQCLPGSTPPVPGDATKVRGQKYASSTQDWLHPTFLCAGFSVPEPQTLQLQWLRESASRGTALARGDIDGDGTAELTFSLAVECEDATGRAWSTTGAQGRCRCLVRSLESK